MRPGWISLNLGETRSLSRAPTWPWPSAQQTNRPGTRSPLDRSHTDSAIPSKALTHSLWHVSLLTGSLGRTRTIIALYIEEFLVYLRLSILGNLNIFLSSSFNIKFSSVVPLRILLKVAAFNTDLYSSSHKNPKNPSPPPPSGDMVLKESKLLLYKAKLALDSEVLCVTTQSTCNSEKISYLTKSLKYQHTTIAKSSTPGHD